MKRPLGYVCLFFVLFIRVYYVCFPPVLPDYRVLQGWEVYISGQVISQQYQEINNEICVVYTVKDVKLQENRETKSCYLSDKSNLHQNTQDIYVHEQIYCYSSVEYPEVYIGSGVWMKGTFEPYTAPENPGQFDSQLYYHIQGVGGCLQETELVGSDGRKDFLRQMLYDLKQYFGGKIDIHFTERYGGVMKTILLGDKSDLEKDLKTLFREGGILHILTISGLHISMLGMNSFRLLRKAGLSQRFSAVVGMGIVLLYGVMIGTQAATFRAICMFSMQMAAILLGRTYDRLTGLAVAAVLLLLEQPMYVFYSGFLLSFGAVLGITVLTPIVEKLCKDKGTIIEWFGKLFGGGIGILLATFPMQLYYYYEYPVYSMLINIIILPFLPYIVGFGAVVLAIPQRAAILTVPFVYVSEWLLWGYEWICRKSRTLPKHCLVLGAPVWWQILLYYGCLILLVWCLKGTFKVPKINHKRVIKRRQHLANILPLGAFVVAAGITLWRPVAGVTCSFLSVGQGDCTVFRYGQEAYVIDCGSTSKGNVGTQILLPCLKYYGISEVNGVFLSHADQDHISGIIQWLEAYEHSHVHMRMLVLPDLEEKALTEEFAEVLALAEKHAIPTVTVGTGDILNLGALDIKVLNPRKGTEDTEDANAYSQVLLFSYNGRGILFSGDIGEKQEAMLLEQLAEEYITLLKAPHHGSKYSSSEAFLEVCSPEHIVLSYGLGNSYGHPHKEAVTRMEAVCEHLWYTGRQGAILADIQGDVKVYGFKR